MDPLSISASVAGLVTLATTIVGSGSAYITSVREFPKELENLLCETHRLNTILQQIAEFVQATTGGSTTTLKKLSEIITPQAIHKADTLLKSVKTMLEGCQQVHGARGKNSVKAIIWPFKEREAKTTLEEFRRLATTLDQAINVDSSRTLHDIYQRGIEFYNGASSTLAEVKKRTRAIADEQESLKRQKMDTDALLKLHCDSVKTHDTMVSSYITKEEREKILKWLDPASVDPETNHLAARKLAQPGTGEWFFESVQYQIWASTDRSLLWLSAIPGAGKTILMSTIIERLRTNRMDGTGFAYFYCDYKDTVKQTLQGFLSSILVQLCNQSSAFFASVQETYKLQKDCHRALRSDEQVQILKSGMDAAFNQTLILVDALDECIEGNDLIKTLCEINLNTSGFLLSNVKLLVSSRRESYIIDLLGREQLQLELQDTNITGDIKSYIASQLQAMLQGGKLKLRNPALESEIKTTLVAGSHGMFQWVRCQLAYLCTLTNDKAIRSALQNLPKGIDETYVRILEKIKRDNAERMPEILNLLQWIAASKRPLTVDELAEAITIEPGAKYLDFDAVATKPEDVLRPCSTLVVVTPVQRSEKLYRHVAKRLREYEIVYRRHPATLYFEQPFERTSETLQVGFSHFSIKEFLVSARILEYPTVSEFFLGDSEKLEAKLFADCVTYLSFDDFCDPNLVEIASEHKYSLLSYAANFWPRRLSAGQQDMLNEMLFRHTDERANFVHWVALLDSDEFEFTYDPKKDFICEWELGKDWGGERGEVVHVVKFRNSEYQRKYMVTPLMMSAQLGYERLVDLLAPLEVAVPRIHHREIAKINRYKNDHWLGIVAYTGLKSWMIALDFAVVAGRVEVVETLLARGKELNTAERVDTWSCLSHVILQLQQWGIFYRTGLALATKILKLLIDHGADVNLYGNIFQAACFNGHSDTAKILIELGADVNATGEEYGNALQAACCNGHSHTVKVLIELGADVNATGGIYWNALQAACYNGHSHTVKVLIEHGADVNATGGEYGSALQAALCNGHDYSHTVKVLIEHGADVNVTGGKYGSALQAACWHGNLCTAWLLIKHGADVNATGGTYGNALQAACYYGNSGTAKLLIEHGADVNATGGAFRNALQAASYHGDSGIVKLLIEHGAVDQMAMT